MKNKFLFLVVFIVTVNIDVNSIEHKYLNNLFYNDINYSISKSDSLRLSLDLSYFETNNNTKFSTIIFFYGGGLTQGNKYIPKLLINNEFIVAAPNYRLSPNVSCPVYIEDVASAIAWVFKNINKYGGDSTRIYLVGSSSGAYLSNMVFWDKSYLEKYNIDSDNLAGFFSISSQLTTHFVVCKEMGMNVNSGTTYIDKFAPLFHARYTNVPISYFIGDRNLDEPGRFIQNTLMVDTLLKIGCKDVSFKECSRLNHGINLELVALDSIVSKIKQYENVKASSKTILQDNITFYKVGNFIHVRTDQYVQDIEFYNIYGVKVKTYNIINSGLNFFDISKYDKKILIIKYKYKGVNKIIKFLN